MRVWYLEKRRHRYHFRARVPGDIAAVTGRSHVIVSLRTGDLGQAKIFSARIFFLLAASYDQIRAKMREFFTPAEPDTAEAQRLGERIFALGAEYEARRNALIEEFSARRQAIINEVFGLRQSFTAGFHIRGAGMQTSSLDDSHLGAMGTPDDGIILSKLSNDMPNLVFALSPVDESWAKNTGNNLENQQPRQTRDLQIWSDHCPAFFRDKPALSAKTIVSYRQAFDDWGALIGKKPLADIRRKDLKLYADFLRDKENIRGGKLSRETIVRALSHIKSFLTWGIGAGLLSDDQFHLVQARDETQEERAGGPSRLAFTNEHLVSIFSSPVFLKRAGKFPEARAWFLLLSLFTGARTEELARAPAKLVKLDDIYCLDLRDSGEKTAAAPRLVPLHPELIRLGILVWAERQNRKGYTLVQPEDEQLEARNWSKQLNRFIDKQVTEDPTFALYSLRHNFRQSLRASGMSEELANKFFGHTDKSVGAGYGRNLSVDEARVFVNLVKPPLCLKHISAISK